MLRFFWKRFWIYIRIIIVTGKNNSSQEVRVSMHPRGFYLVRVNEGTTYQFRCLLPVWIESGPAAGLAGKTECYNRYGSLQATCIEFAERYKLKKSNCITTKSDSQFTCNISLLISESLNSTNITCEIQNSSRFRHFIITGNLCMWM